MNSGLLRVFNGSAGFLDNISRVNGGSFLINKYGSNVSQCSFEDDVYVLEFVLELKSLETCKLFDPTVKDEFDVGNFILCISLWGK